MERSKQALPRHANATGPVQGAWARSNRKSGPFLVESPASETVCVLSDGFSCKMVGFCWRSDLRHHKLVVYVCIATCYITSASTYGGAVCVLNGCRAKRPLPRPWTIARADREATRAPLATLARACHACPGCVVVRFPKQIGERGQQVSRGGPGGGSLGAAASSGLEPRAPRTAAIGQQISVYVTDVVQVTRPASLVTYPVTVSMYCKGCCR